MRAALRQAFSLGSLSVLAAAAAAGCQAEEKQVIRDQDEVIVAAVPPPPISGGTLIVTADETRAVAADSDRDLVWVVDLAQKKLERSISLQKGDEPGRLVEDAAGLVHVALRSAGAVVTLDPATGKIVRRADICAAPRGLAFDAPTGHLHVACAEGALVTVDAATGTEVRRLTLDTDLRDVVVQGDHLLVTRFRSAEVLSIDVDGNVLGRGAPPVAWVPDFSFDGAGGDAPGVEVPFAPSVAWRTVASPTGGVVMVHQRGKDAEIELDTPGGYGEDGCGSIVHAAVTEVGMNEDGTAALPVEAMTRIPAVLPTDIAISKDGSTILVAAAGSDTVFRSFVSDIEFPAAEMCGLNGLFVQGEPLSVAFRGMDAIVQTREPASITIVGENAWEGEVIALPGVSVRDTGHELFHLPPSRFGSNGSFGGDVPNSSGSGGGVDSEPGFFGGSSLACASCHPEGGDDSRVWNFQGVGPRRTQAMRGGILATAPLHWDGDMQDVSAIMDEVFTRRMGGAVPGPVKSRAIARWVDLIPAAPSMRDPEDAAALRGKDLFESAAVGCAQCHNGPMLTNNQNASIGRGESLQVPSLVNVAWRAPFMHDGCAATLLDRFDPACGGSQHGDVSGLSPADLGDLVAYLESL